MTDDTPLTDPRPFDGGRFAAPDAVWERVRDDYLGGLSAPDACRRHGVRLTALRARAAREGWRRIDQLWAPPPNTLDAEDEGMKLEDRVGGDLDKIDLCELSFVAHRRMMRAVLRGQADAALRWRRVMRAMDEEEAEMDRAIAQHEALRHERNGWADLSDEQAPARAAAAAAAPTASDAADAEIGFYPGTIVDPADP